MKAIRHLVGYLGLLEVAAAGVGAYAAEPVHAPAAQEQKAGAAVLTTAEVIKVDPARHKVTLKHGQIKNLHMPPMTMDYNVKDDALFAQLKPGSRIRFAADRIDGDYTVLSAQAAQ